MKRKSTNYTQLLNRLDVAIAKVKNKNKPFLIQVNPIVKNGELSYHLDFTYLGVDRESSTLILKNKTDVNEFLADYEDVPAVWWWEQTEDLLDEGNPREWCNQ